MADEIQADASAAQETPSSEGSESSLVENQKQEVQSEGQEEQTKTTGESQVEEQPKAESETKETGDQSGQKEAKPSRVERRIQSLISKIKEGSESKVDAPKQQEPQPYFTEEEIEQGRIDPNTLMQRIQANVQTEVQKAIQMDRVNQQYESAVKSHQSDLEGIKDIDPDLEAEAVAEYEALNYQINPYTGKKVFVPAVKLSEIVSKIETRARKLAEKMAENIAEGNKEYLKSVSSSQAVPSSGAVTGTKSVTPDTTNFSEFEKAYSS